MKWQGWRSAMTAALYGPAGFYLSAGAPGRHFRTSAHVGAPWVAAIRELAQRVEHALGCPSDFAIVDVGAGGGELLAGLADRAPDHWTLIGVDVAPRPDSLPDRVEWRTEPPTAVRGLLLAVELLDVVPVEVVEMTAHGPRLVEVNQAGDERLGSEPDSIDVQWQQRWWPVAELGDRIEVGRYRDDAWRTLIATLDAGIAIAVDYGVNVDAHRDGTLTGFRDGRQVAPIPDGSCDLTAHVMFDSLRRPGDLLLPQRDVLSGLGVRAARPSYDGDPAAYLSSLAEAGAAAELLSEAGLGGFNWLVHGGCVDPESVLRQSKPAARTSERTSSTHR